MIKNTNLVERKRKFYLQLENKYVRIILIKRKEGERWKKEY